MENRYYSILLLVLLGLGFSFSGLTQDDFDVDEYLKEINYEGRYDQSEAYKQYLKEEVILTKFDREKWERLRLNIVNEFTGVEYVGEDGGSYTQRENPYRQRRGSYREYMERRNAERIKRLPKKERPPRRQQQSEPIELQPLGAFWSNLILILVIIGFAFLVFYLFFNQIQEGKGNKKVTSDINSIKPTEIPKTELELLLEKALAQEDYREAIRIYFIFIIRGLIEKNWIEWEKEKTNIAYLREMRDKPYSQEFESTVSVYEIVWYGEREVSREEYDLLEPRFKELTHNLGQK